MKGNPMANGHGGARTPANPAPVSGPGKFSQRTDGGPSQVRSVVPDQPYGDAKQQMADQSLQPMAGQEPVNGSGGLPNVSGVSPLEPHSTPYSAGDFNAPSSRPNEPITAGVPIGPG